MPPLNIIIFKTYLRYDVYMCYLSIKSFELDRFVFQFMRFVEVIFSKWGFLKSANKPLLSLFSTVLFPPHPSLNLQSNCTGNSSSQSQITCCPQNTLMSFLPKCGQASGSLSVNNSAYNTRLKLGGYYVLKKRPFMRFPWEENNQDGSSGPNWLPAV